MHIFVAARDIKSTSGVGKRRIGRGGARGRSDPRGGRHDTCAFVYLRGGFIVKKL